MLPSVFICIKEFNGNKVNLYYQIKVSPVLPYTCLLLCDTLHNLQSKVEWGGGKVARCTLTDVFIYFFTFCTMWKNIHKTDTESHEIIEGSEIEAPRSQM